MSITEIPALNRRSSSFKDDVDTYFGTIIPNFTTEMNTEIERINSVGAGSYSATSTTSLTIGTGDKTLIIETGKSFAVGQYVAITDSANTANYMRGSVKTYNIATGALVVTVTAIGGSGTKTAWGVGLQVVASADIQLDSLVELTSGTSWTCPAGVRRVKLTMSGGGGSGSTSNNDSYVGTDGAGGGGIVAVFQVTAGQSYAYTVGAGGTAVSGSNQPGNAGANSTFVANGITYTAFGGYGGLVSGQIAVGGSGSGSGAAVMDGQDGIFTQYTSLVSGGLGCGGGMSVLGKSGGKGGKSTTTSTAGVNGKIILELYK